PYRYATCEPSQHCSCETELLHPAAAGLPSRTVRSARDGSSGHNTSLLSRSPLKVPVCTDSSPNEIRSATRDGLHPLATSRIAAPGPFLASALCASHPICTASMEIDPPSTPSTGNRMRSPFCPLPRM